jgi:hypothetical protein
MKKLLISALMLIPALASADISIPINHSPRHIKYDTIGAVTLEDAKQLGLMLQSRDKQGLETLNREYKIASVPQGTEVYLEAITAYFDQVQININGTKLHLWVRGEAVVD